MIQLIIGGFAALCASLVGRLLVGAGLTLALYVGMDTLIGGYLDNAISSFDGVIASIGQLALLAGAGDAMQILFSAVLTRVAINAAIASVGVVSK